jgi:hypothetical protein
VSTASTLDTAARRSPASPAGGPRAGAAARRGRTGIVITIVVALILSAVLQQVAFSYRNRAVNRNRPDANPAASRLANLDSFSLALLLGGLRGPLVMFLWTQSEQQKSEKDLEGFDTQVELIRLLQPEFASVHLFQIWNKAYNISVQMASLANKYASILDAIEYARRTDRMNPNDINIVSAIGGLYAEKLGNSAEKEYYRRRVRSETLPVYRVTFSRQRVEEFRKAVRDAGLDETRLRIDTSGDPAIATIDKLGGDRVLANFTGPDVNKTAVPRQKLRPENHTDRRFDMDTLLDESGNLLPELIAPAASNPGGDPRGNNGAELQYLAQFQPYPYGVSPVALGYNYYKRAQALSRFGRQKHIQLSEMVVDNQPGLTLRVWSDEEWDRGRRLEQRAFAGGAAADQQPRELRTSKVAPDAKPADRSVLDEAIFSYDRAARTAEAAIPEFTSHIERYPSGLQNFGSHMQTAYAVWHLTAADAAYLRAIAAATPEARKTSLDAAKAEYLEALRRYYVLILGYYAIDPDMKAVGYTRSALPDMKLDQLEGLITKFNQRIETTYKGLQMTPNGEDISEYRENIHRIKDRLSLIK